MDISVIIINYRSEKFLAPCISSVQTFFKNISYEIIIINNDSTSLKDIAEIPYVKVMNLPLNEGFATACNIGAEIAKSKILFFLNPDTQIANMIEDELISALNFPGVGIVAPTLILPNKEIQPWSAGQSLNLWALLKNNFAENKHFNNKEAAFDWVSGAAFFISKKLFTTINGFDEKFFMYFEDIDLCKRIRNKKFLIHRLSSFSVIHFGGQSYDNKALQKEHYYASQDYYFKKHFGILISYLVKVIRTISYLLR
ncbi:MAG: glycosyl transferase family 2 [Candidatus Moranbacteria bacterium GW2011_GWC2_37_8]|nr:MAG: glycosyl transferase family 2 [Candidatus Moranbacteria bacterium GW2011_GWC2_37_8]KKQ60945.1 MAG: glycosyl transferase family 2 [Parcubacteria group bacterium GW2011_GWC1_38_22]KKQ80124.1 MAG: glycosyl transferase family 2 [Candidatus Moranbacteria bacterium GW2011_GWD2_38_7]